MNSQAHNPKPHDEFASLIPWFVKGTLSPAENQAVKQHLIDCKVCQQEVAACQTLQQAIPQPPQWKPSAAHFAGILAEVDKLEAAKTTITQAVAKPVQKKTKKPSLFQRLANTFSQTPNAIRWTLAVESMAFAALAAVLVVPQLHQFKNIGAFETLSSGEATATSGQLLRLALADDMSVKELSGLLAQTQAQIRQGPSTVGTYTIEIPKDQTNAVMATLRTNSKVKLVLEVKE